MTKRRQDGYARFPTTRSSIVASRPGERGAPNLEELARAYRPPVRTYARTRWNLSAAAAEDAVQEFFLRCIERGTFSQYDSSRGRFRTFLRVCFDRFAIDRHRRDAAAKRGGGQTPVALSGTEPGLAAADSSNECERLLEQAWARHVVDEAIRALQAELEQRSKLEHWRAFEMTHLHNDDHPPSYAQVADALGITVTDVTNRLSYARRTFRAAVIRVLRGLSADPLDLQDDVTALIAACGGDLLSRRP